MTLHPTPQRFPARARPTASALALTLALAPMRTGSRLARVLPSLLLLAAPLVLPIGIAAQTIEIRPVLTEGFELRQEMSSLTRSALPMGMGEMLEEQVMVSVSRVTQLAADGSGVLETVIESARMRSDSPMGSERWDSTTDEEPANRGFRFIAQMVGRVTEQRFGAGGTIETATVMDDARGLVRAAGGDPEVIAATEGFLGDFEASISGAPNVLQGPITVGETREFEMSLPIPLAGASRMVRRYTLDRVEARDGIQVAVFLVSGQMVSEGGGAGALADLGLSMGPAATEGEMVFDLDRGMLLESVERQTLTSEVMGMAMTVVSETRIRTLR
jgi:hypothetical protein